MERDEVKKKIYEIAPQSWFSKSGLALGVFEEDDSLNTIISTRVIESFDWNSIKIYTEKICPSNISFNIYVNEDFYRNVSLVANLGKTNYSFSIAKPLFEGDIISIQLVEMPNDFRNKRLFISFFDSTWDAFLNAITEFGYYYSKETEKLNNDLFLKTATGIRLDTWARDVSELQRGVFDTDNVFRQKILAEILKPKQTRLSFEESLQSILNEYYPIEEYGGTYAGFYSSGSGSSTILHSGTTYIPSIVECFKEDAPYVNFDDKGQPGIVYITIPYELLNERSEEIFKSMGKTIANLKAKGVKIVLIKDTKTTSVLQEKYIGKTTDELDFLLTWDPPTMEDKLVHTLTGSPSDIEYLTQDELDNFIANYGSTLDIPDIRNKIIIEKISGPDEYNEQVQFNQYAFYVGESRIFSEFAPNTYDFPDNEQDPFIYVPVNFDRVLVLFKDNIDGITPDEIKITEF